MIKPKDFSGMVHTVVTWRHNGFPNYRLVSMRIEKGVVKEVTEVTDPYNYYETIIRLEHKNEMAISDLNKRFPEDPDAREGLGK